MRRNLPEVLRERGPQALTLGARGQPGGESMVGVVDGQSSPQFLDRGLTSAFDAGARGRIEPGLEPAGQVPRELGVADLVAGDGRHGAANGSVSGGSRLIHPH
jgi:hypothetical protein